jgi:hypothetical protein
MSKREKGLTRINVNRKGKYQYVIEEKGKLFFIKQNENIVVIPAEDLKRLIEKFAVILERQEQKRTASHERHFKLYEPQSARQQRDKKQKSGEMK